MYPPGMGRLASMLISLAFCLIIGVLFIHQTSATFFVEITDKNVNSARITLYECNAERMDAGNQSPGKPTPTNNNDITCNEVNERRKKKVIYSMANFYMIANTELDENKRIFLQRGKKGSHVVLGSSTKNHQILVGVIIMKGVQEIPALRDASDPEDVLPYFHSECQAVPIVPKFVPGKDYKEFLLYLSIANFRNVVNPPEKLVERFMVFGEAVAEVENIYTRDVRLAKETNVDKVTKMEIKEKIAAASRLLNQKLIDPCLFLTGVGKTDLEIIEMSTTAAETQCNNYCKFLAVGFSSNRIASSNCSAKRDTVGAGKCYKNRCYCEKRASILGVAQKGKYFSLIECSNDLRIKTAAVALKTPALASWTSIRQSFSRTMPKSLLKTFSNDRGVFGDGPRR